MTYTYTIHEESTIGSIIADIELFMKLVEDPVFSRESALALITYLKDTACGNDIALMCPLKYFEDIIYDQDSSYKSIIAICDRVSAVEVD